MKPEKWETVIGLEVHTELSTKSKIFCGCSTAFGGEPNTQVCPVCAGMPGTLPKLNRAVVEYAMLVGLALNCRINQNCKFDRKNYFYPDLPKAYQVSQLYTPICSDGHMEILNKTIRIREIHMEEDAGKLIHDLQSDATFMDFNRCGVPLLEIVTQPDFRSGFEVIAYLEKLRETLLYLGVSDCKMQEGSIRADVNLSIRRTGGELGVRTEMKNLNSFKAIGRAIEYESARQIKIIESGGTILQETRRWDDDTGESYAMRSKENAQDYRYFPEPDLLPISIDDTWLSRIKESMPELAHQKRERYSHDYRLSDFETTVITSHKSVSDLFEAVIRRGGEPVETAHLVTGEIMRLMSATNTLPENLSLDEVKLAKLISLVVNGSINRNAYKETVEAVFMCDADPEAYIDEKGLRMINDDAAIASAVDDIIAANLDAVADWQAGKEKAYGFLMGQVMRRLGGAGDPQIVRALLSDKLNKADEICK